MKIYVDRLTGTWGHSVDLIMVETDLSQAELDGLCDMTDTDRALWAEQKRREFYRTDYSQEV